jgi:hypothetical protein
MSIYEQKFAGLLRMCNDARRDGVDTVLIAEPEALGDTYEELIESLNRIADAKLSLSIVPRAERAP